ncbi:hypothetical protein WG899_14570 [Paucibacter sp. AS339]
MSVEIDKTEQSWFDPVWVRIPVVLLAGLLGILGVQLIMDWLARVL